MTSTMTRGRHLSIAVVGADFPNKRGPARRFEIALCKPGERIELRPEPRNPADPRAVAVFSARGIQIGYVPAERAALVGAALREGRMMAIFQSASQWGATVRASLDGSEPTLPAVNDSCAEVWPPPGSDDADWWPDEEWPDQ